MSILRDAFERWRNRNGGSIGGKGKLVPGQWGGDEPPVIQTQWGPVSESARYRAALNMREDPDKRLQVEQLLANQIFYGNLEKGREESRKRYPEAYR